MPIGLSELAPWILPLATVAAAWGGTRQALNGTRERVKDINSKMDLHIQNTLAKHTEISERLATVETKVDMLKGDFRCEVRHHRFAED